MSGSDYDLSCRVNVIGGAAVGKTALTIQFTANQFVEEYDPTIEDSYRKQCLVDEQVYIIELLDTCGQEEFQALRGNWIRNYDGTVVVYSIASRASFEQALQCIKSEQRLRDRKRFPLVICGNKCDLASEMRQVSTVEGRQLADTFDGVFFETSAKTAVNVDSVFAGVVREVQRHRDPDFVRVRSLVSKRVVMLILLARRFDSQCDLRLLPVALVRMCAQLVYSSRKDPELWSLLIKRERVRIRGEKKGGRPCVIH